MLLSSVALCPAQYGQPLPLLVLLYISASHSWFSLHSHHTFSLLPAKYSCGFFLFFTPHCWVNSGKLVANVPSLFDLFRNAISQFFFAIHDLSLQQSLFTISLFSIKLSFLFSP